MPKHNDKWVAGSTYENFMGKWSRQLAPKFVAWLNIPAGCHWLDVGCGTGALTDVICKVSDPASVVGCDPAAPLVDYAREHYSTGPVSFVNAGVGSIPNRAGGFGSVTSSLALNFFPDPGAAITEMREVAAKKATISACVWDYSGRMEFLRYFWDSALRLNPDARELDEGVRFPLCQPDALIQLFCQAGLKDVFCEPIEITTAFPSFDEFWSPFLGGTGPAPSYVAALDDAMRQVLTVELNQCIPRRSDGTIALRAQAWAVRGDG